MEHTIKIGSKEYGDAFNRKQLPSVAVYVALCKIHSGKNFYFKPGEKTKVLKNTAMRIGLTYHSLTKHLKILQDLGLADIFSN